MVPSPRHATPLAVERGYLFVACLFGTGFFGTGKASPPCTAAQDPTRPLVPLTLDEDDLDIADTFHLLDY